MRIYGIDPAPSSPTTVVTSGESGNNPAEEYEPQCMISFCKRVSEKKEPALLCWDAPLTGPAFREDGGLKTRGRMFSQRKIDSYFSSPSTGCDTPNGISTRPYSGCSHWAISRACTGYPRIGPYDIAEENLPFALKTDDTPPEEGLSIVEVHPALALWIMAKQQDEYQIGDSLKYKGSGSKKEKKERRMQLFEGLREFVDSNERAGATVEQFEGEEPPSHDELDALTAFALGVMWLEASGNVRLLGSYAEGAFLLPYDKDVFEGFESFSFSH